MSYFQRHYPLFRYPLESEDNAGFRPAQVNAIHAVAGHFGQRHDPTIVTMPTGSGKTGVMIACTFVLRANRVLVVTPSRLVREQITEEVADLVLLRKLGALPNDVERPRVCSVGERITTPTRWRELGEYHVVVGTVQSISPALESVADPEPDRFDLVLVDEAHHNSAHTWQALLDCFPSAQHVLFTATPFRRDGREIRGRFVFTYELKQAHHDGVFGRIRYKPVEARGDQWHRDVAVAKATEAQWQGDHNAGLDHLVMVRTDRKTRANELAEIYTQHTGLRLVSLNRDHSLRHAKGVIKKLRTGELDGIITVNMFGEGFDFPRLKIAMEGEPRILPLARINRALNGLKGVKFYNVGLRNRVMGSQTESYRTITGPSADHGILPSDARLFHRGHCFGSAEDGDA